MLLQTLTMGLSQGTIYIDPHFAKCEYKYSDPDYIRVTLLMKGDPDLISTPFIFIGDSSI